MTTNETKISDAAARSEWLKRLSPAKRALLLKLLQEEAAGQENGHIITRRPPSDRAHLSFAQQRLWFIDQLEPGSPLYNVPEAVSLKGSLNLTALAQSFDEIVRRHDALRTTFAVVDDQPVQIIARGKTAPLLVVDLSGLPEAKREVCARRLAAKEARRPFDLANDLPLRTALLRRDEREHWILLTLHHIISDGWSMGVFMRETTALYEAFSKGRPSPLDDLPIQYADYAIWQRERLSGDILDRELAYWRKQLSGAPLALNLPTDYLRPSVQKHRGARQSILIAKSVSEELGAISRRENATLFMTLLAAFGELLRRYTGEHDITIGSPIASRILPEVEGLIGFFVNALVMRIDLSGAPTFLELISRARETSISAYAHQELPFEKLLEELSPERDLSRHSLFQVAFVVQNAPLPALKLPGGRIEPIEIENYTAKFDLTLSIEEAEDGLKAYLEYDTDLFAEQTIIRLLTHFEILLSGIVENPRRRISDLPLLSEAEYRLLLAPQNTPPLSGVATDLCVCPGGNAGAGAGTDTQVCPYHNSAWPPTTLHRLFEAQAARTPDAIALVFEEEVVTYGALNRRANQTAHYLRRLGVGPETPVGLMMERSSEGLGYMIVGLIGILKAGGAYVPLDPTYPRERLSFMLEDTLAPVLLTQRKFTDHLSERGVQKIYMDADWETIAAESGEDPLGQLPPENPAYVIYTSGSTGKPKGVVVSHGNVARLFTATQHWFHFERRHGQQDVWTLFHSYAFDFSVWEIWGALLYGGKLVAIPYWVSRTPESFYDLLVREQATILNQTPSAFRQLIRSTHLNSATDQSQIKALRYVIFGGEALDLKSLGPWFDRHHDAQPQLVNMYGITETCVHVTYRPLTAADLAGGSVIGESIPDLSVYAFDQHLRPVPIGVSGELYVGGRGLSRGYLHRPELTAERFIPNSFSFEPGERLYRTGDRARFLPDGDIEYLGRVDHQVKLRGLRIELGEIEAVLNRHPAARDAVVLARGDEPEEKRLIAYVVPNPEYGVSNAEVTGAEQVSQWELVFDETYEQKSRSIDPTFNISGWNNSYTGLPLAEADMREWVDNTVERILARRPRRALEIGCGTGLLLFRLAPRCVEYLGTDFAQVALDYIRRTLTMQRNELPQLTLVKKNANDFDGIEAGAFDAVVLNSIVQYFPSIDYLLDVLKGAVKAVSPGGFIFIGDVRNLRLLEAFHLSLQLHQAPDSLRSEQLRWRVKKQMEMEEELVIDPAFFVALKQKLPNLCGVEILLKRGVCHNELTRFRYDVALRVGTETPSAVAGPGLNWQDERLNLASLRRLLQDERPDMLYVRRVPNRRVFPEVKALEWMAGAVGPKTAGELRQIMDRGDETRGVNPEDFWSLSDSLPYSVSVTWSSDDNPGCFDALFVRRDGPTTDVNSSDYFPLGSSETKAWADYANNPLRGKFMRKLTPELRGMLQKHLPDYMMPAAFVMLDALPLTPNGKLDRRSLPPPDESRPDLEHSFAPARTRTETILAEMFSQVLDVHPVGVYDNFFDLGGHSLLATQLLSRMRESFQLKELSLRSLFEAPTVAGIAERIDTARAAGRPSTDLSIRPVSHDEGLPLSFAQQRLWFLSELEPGSASYNVPAAMRVSGSFNGEALRQSLSEIVRRHEALRTRIAKTAGRDVQIIDEAAPLELTLADLRGLPVAGREGKAMRLAKAMAQRPFDMSRGPLLRVSLLLLDEDEYILVIVMHHIVSDGWSIGVLIGEETTIYEAFSAGRPSPLAALPIQYADFAHWQRRWLESEEAETQLTYWRRQLANASPLLRLPTDYPRPLVRTGRGARRPVALPLGLTQGLKDLSQREGATLFMCLLAAFKTLLYRYTGQTDIVIGSDIANRNRVEVESLIGFFSNMLVLRTELSDSLTFRELLARVREVTLEAYANQDVPFEKLVEVLQPRRDLRYTPLFQVVFTLQNAPTPPLELPGLRLDLVEVDYGASKFDLVMNMWDLDQGLAGSLEYNTDLFVAPTILRMLGHFKRLLTSAVAAPDARLKDLEIFSEEERTFLGRQTDIEELQGSFSF